MGPGKLGPVSGESLNLLDMRGLSAAGTQDEIRANVVHALSLNLPELPASIIKHDGTMVICGSGPSLPGMREAIEQERNLGRPLVAVKGAYNQFMDWGITPDFYVSIDPRDRRNTVKTLNKDTIYLLSSRCPPSLFEHLGGHKVVLFHTWSPEQDIPELHGRPLVTGGSTSGLRMVTIGYAWGFRKFAFYGMDSCAKDDHKRFYGPPMPDEKLMDVVVAGRSFRTNGAMALQAQDFRDMIRMMPETKFSIAGDGLLAAIYAEFRRLRCE
jgi:uncharacterized Rossmann fold enzyme